MRYLLACVGAVVLSVGCSRPRVETAFGRPLGQLEGYQRHVVWVTRQMVLNHLRTRERILNRSVHLTMCMPDVPAAARDSVRAALQSPKITLACPPRHPRPDTVEQLHVEFLRAEGDSVVMSALRFAPHAGRPSWREVVVGYPGGPLGLAMTIAPLPGGWFPTTPTGAPDSTTALLSQYFEARGWVGVPLLSDTACVASPDPVVLERLRGFPLNTGHRYVRPAADCGRSPGIVSGEIFDLYERREDGPSNWLSTIVRQPRGANGSHRIESFSRGSDGGWKLFFSLWLSPHD